MLRHRINLLIIDLFLVALSYFTIICFKGGFDQYLTSAYVYGLFIFTSIWIIVSALFKKFFPSNPPQNSVSLHIIVINPLIFRKDYAPKISKAAFESLRISDPKDLLMYVIVTLRSPLSQSSANLLGPLFVNYKERLGKQIIIDDTSYSVREKIID